MTKSEVLRRHSFREYATYQYLRAHDLTRKLVGDNNNSGPGDTKDNQGHIHELLADDYEVEILNRKNAYPEFLRYLDGEKDIERPNGERAGSRSSRLVREKFILKLRPRNAPGTTPVYCE